MFNRKRQKRIALIALVALWVAAFVPATQSYSRMLDGDRLVALGGICSVLHGIGGSTAPAVPSDVPSLQHCAFCVAHTPFVPASRITAWVTLLDVPAAKHPPDFAPAWRHRAGALHPLSPRAPPRAV